MRILILIGMLFTAPALLGGETIYQWTDKDGNTHFSESPPPAGTEAVQRNLEPMPKVGTVDPYLDADETKQLTAEQVNRENEELTQRRLDATTREEQLAIECETAQGVIDKLSSARYAKIASPDGSVRVMSDAEREDRIRTSEKYIDENCL